MGLGLMIFTCLGQVSYACLDQGVASNMKMSKGLVTFSLGSEKSYEIYGKKNPLLPMLRLSEQTQTEICLTNTYEQYPIQLVADFRDFSPASQTERDCVKKGFIRKVYVSSNYDWFHLEDGFSMRVTHKAKITPNLYNAAFSKKEVCITEMNLDATDGSWGIPREMEI
jgi:hypothetical protein